MTIELGYMLPALSIPVRLSAIMLKCAPERAGVVGATG